jgi:Skp family chaperone for outer membrane proteins
MEMKRKSRKKTKEENMRIRIVAITLVAALLIGFGIWSNRSADGKDMDSKTRRKICFLDLKKVLLKYKLSKQLEVEIVKYTEEATKKIQDLKDKIKVIEDELKLLIKNTDTWLAHNEKIIILKNALKTREKLLEVKTQQKLIKAIEKTYASIVDSLARYAKKRGIDYVLKTESAMISAETGVELAMKINCRLVLYRSKGLDITEDFIKYLNDL